ncbi:MAG TPA: hypothetical protein VFX98_06130, partial [Longimicrobiaceae bacterium]|nr:hypothetical protein [Longimicrobiaceae bacterium]
MGELLDWEPLVWAFRIALLTFTGVGTLVFVLLLARFLRPDSIWRLLTAKLPAVSKVEGEFAGAKGSLEFVAAQGEPFDTL